MLDRAQRPLRSDRFQSAVEGLSLEPAKQAVQPRVVVVVLLITAGVVWAIVRGVEFYGLSPAHLFYDLDQPPLLLVLVGSWLLYRSRRR